MAEKLPYIISADAENLMKQWGEKNKLQVPDSGFFVDFQRGLMDTLRQADDAIEPVIVPYDELAAGLSGMVSTEPKSSLVSLDRVYMEGIDVAGYLDMTRAVGMDLSSIGTQPRPGALPINQQMDAIAKLTDDEITLIDDVIFSGEAAMEVVGMLRERGKRVVRVLAAVAIGEGREKIEADGIELGAVVDYADVMDEICERDFMAGIPYSGRTVYNDRSLNIYRAAPYFRPFGSPEQWASITGDKAARNLSRYCIDRSVELWERIERLNDVVIMSAQVPRPIDMQPGQERFVNRLRNAGKDL